jgi:hypothetical protein
MKTVFQHLNVEQIGDGTSRCECCGFVTPADALRNTRLGWSGLGHRDIKAACRRCRNVVELIAMRTMADVVSVQAVRDYRNSEVAA